LIVWDVGILCFAGDLMRANFLTVAIAAFYIHDGTYLHVVR
jgi:hypothetical protein